jgi:hypothetical protein
MSVERRTVDKDLSLVLSRLRREFGKRKPNVRIDAIRYYPESTESIWVRVIDPAVKGTLITERDFGYWDIVRESLPENLRTQVWMVFVLAPDELKRSATNLEFEDPHPPG